MSWQRIEGQRASQGSSHEQDHLLPLLAMAGAQVPGVTAPTVLMVFDIGSKKPTLLQVSLGCMYKNVIVPVCMSVSMHEVSVCDCVSVHECEVSVCD